MALKGAALQSSVEFDHDSVGAERSTTTATDPNRVASATVETEAAEISPLVSEVRLIDVGVSRDPPAVEAVLGVVVAAGESLAGGVDVVVAIELSEREVPVEVGAATGRNHVVVSHHRAGLAVAPEGSRGGRAGVFDGSSQAGTTIVVDHVAVGGQHRDGPISRIRVASFDEVEGD